MNSSKIDKKSLERRIDAALGRIPCELIIEKAEFLDVFSCDWKKGDIAVIDGTIVGIDGGLSGRRTIDAKGKRLVPGFIDAHVHVESSLMVPGGFDSVVLPRGTTTAICDPHELANVAGVAGINYFLEAATRMNLDLRVMLSSCVPATHLETNGGGEISASQLIPLASHPKALGLAEMMNMPGVLHKDPGVMEKIEVFSGGIIDGHCPLLSGKDLSAYAATGISSCHESTQYDEALEKLSKGISIWIREGSVAKDLNALSPLLTLARSTSVGFCTDDRNPLDIFQEGHIDYLVRGAIKNGVPVEVAYRSASWTVARHYGLRNKGAIAPGYEADFVLLDDVKQCSVNSVYRRGILASEMETATIPSTLHGNSVRASKPELADLEGPKGRVHVIEVKAGSILTGRHVENSDAPGVAKLSVLERYGRNSKPANGYASGFGMNFKGAIASSVGHDSHNLIVVGSHSKAMQVALAALIECGGGFCVVHNDEVASLLSLPFGGLMSMASPRSIEKSLRELRAAAKAIGCELDEPFLQLAFLSLPVIPSLKLTDRGLVDVDAFKVIDVRAA